MSVLSLIVGLVFCIGTFIWWWQRSARDYWEKNGVAYIAGPPFLGILKDTLLFRKSFANVLMDLYNDCKVQNEPIIGVYNLHKPTLIIRHPDIIKKILVTDFSNFADRNAKCDPNDEIGKEGLFIVKGSRWKSIRQKMTPFFTTGKLKSSFHQMLDVSKILEQKLSLEIQNVSREYDMRELTSYFSTDTISICAFGVQANSLLDPNAEFHKYAIKIFDVTSWKRAAELGTCLVLPEVAELLRCSFFSKETNDFIFSSIKYVVEERRKSGQKRNDLIDLLLAIKEEDPDFFKGNTFFSQPISMLAAGHETSSSATAHALYELARHPKIQDKLRLEINSYIEKYGSVQYETINEMEYLHCVIQETLRLYPSVIFLDRICNPVNNAVDYSLEPYHKFSIPKGMPVFIPAIAIHRDPQYYPNPLEFIPERFNSQNQDSINQSTFLPFGIGPRSCVGLRFGYLQVKLFLITMLRNYKVEVCSRTPKTFEIDKKSIILSLKDPLYMNVTKI